MCSIPSIYSKLYGMFSLVVSLKCDRGVAVRYKEEILQGPAVEVSQHGESHSTMNSSPILPTKVRNTWINSV